MSNPEILLAITMWLTWTIRSDPNESERLDSRGGIQMSSVSLQRLQELSSRLDPIGERNAATDVHQLVRFNLYNFGEQSVAVCAIGLENIRGETLRCELPPSIIIAAGARYPMMVEVMNGPIEELARIAVDIRGQRSWVSTHSLPKA